MSHLQEAISNTDIQTQVFFNRTMVQIGMAAFRAGLIRDACYALQEITSSGKVRELLAQGMQAQRFSDKTAEQEKQEKLRQYPFHTHINLELIECVYLVSAMLLEIPNMAQALNPDTKRKVISKSFRRMFDYNDRQSFSGPPENTKDYILAAAKAMAAGELEEARDFLMSIKIWDIMPQAEEIKTMLTLKVQEETLRTYVLSYARYYDSIALSDLSVRFSVPPETVLRLVSKMILHEHISGRLSNDNTLVILDASITDKEQRTIPELNSLADTYLDKVSAYVDMNEKILESKATLVNIQSGYRVNNNRNRNDRRGNKNYVGR